LDLTAANTLLALLDREVWLVTAAAGGVRGGLIATFVNPASIVPEVPRLLVGLARQHHTWQLVEASGALGLHLLAEDNLDWVWRFGLACGRDRDKFEGLQVHAADTGSPLLDGAVGWLDCRVEARLDTGDRTVYLAGVVGCRVTRPAPPLTTRRLMELAPPPLLAELKRQFQHDGRIDAEAIRAWRGRTAGADAPAP
jgi:flavin reductase (DIM6/NTAB) family NADH-FMN oxidoreductase RutF